MSAERIKVLLMTNLFPNSKEPNKGIFVKQEAAELSKLCDMQVVAPVPWFPFKLKFLSKWSINAFIPSAETIDGIPVFHPRWFVTPKILGALYGFYYYLSIRTVTKKIMMTFTFDVIYAQWMYPDGFAAVILGRVFKKPVILQGLGCDVNLYTKFFFRRLMIVWSINNSEKTIVVSEALKDALLKIGIDKQKVIVIPNGVNTDLFKPMSMESCRKEIGLPLDAKIIVFIGSLEEVKGVECLIRSFHELLRSNSGKKILLVMIGEGSFKEKIGEWVEKLGIKDKVTMAGVVKHENIPIWLNASDVFCLPSIREGMPNVILEALACGKYVVATNVGGIPELLKSDKMGILVPPNSATALSGAFEKCLNVHELRAVNEERSVLSWRDNAKEVMNCVSAAVRSFRERA